MRPFIPIFSACLPPPQARFRIDFWYYSSQSTNLTLLYVNETKMQALLCHFHLLTHSFVVLFDVTDEMKGSCDDQYRMRSHFPL